MKNQDLVTRWNDKTNIPFLRVAKNAKILTVLLALSSAAIYSAHAEPSNTIELSQSQISAQGKVTHEGRALQGVSVALKSDRSIATITRADGTFSLNVPSGAPLVFSYVGYETVEVNASTNMTIQLTSSAETLEDLIVVGFGKQKKVNLLGAVDQISAKQFENRPVTNLGAALQGLIPNLNITNGSGNPTSAAGFNIRGTTSINGGSPLILVDNVPHTEAEVARLNPNDFATVTVLKDGSSAAIYGARAAFGVVLITTKTPTSDKVQVNVGYNASFRTVGKMPEVVTDPLTVMEYKRLAATPLYDLFPDAVREYAKQIQSDPSLPRVILDPTNKLNYAYYGSTDWMGESYNKSAPTHTANLTIGKKAESLSYLFSGEYYKQDGMMKFGKDVLNRYNARGKADLKVNDWLTFTNNTLITARDFDSPVFMDGDFFWNVNRTSSLDVPKNPDGSWTSAGAGLLGRMQDGGRTTRRINEFQSTFSAKASIIKNIWDVNADVTFRRGNTNVSSFDVPIPYKTGPDTEIKYAGSTTSYATKQLNNSKYDVINIYTNYNQDFGKHSISGVLGYNQEYSKSETTYASTGELMSQDLPTLQLASGTTTATHSIDDWAVQGIFYRLSYNYAGRYLLESNGRYDGSSRFPDGDRWGFFPSASAGWVISEESFFEPIKSTVNQLKFRATYGSLGNQNVSNYSFVPQMGAGKIGHLLDGKRPIGLNPPGEVSASFTWEKVSTLNFGLDLALLNNKLEITADKYTRKTKDMLVPGRTLPGVFGTASPSFNAGDLKTEGWELRVGWRDNFDLGGSPFHYNAAFVIANSKATITKYNNPTGNLGNYYPGYRFGTMWGYTYDGVFQSEAELGEVNMVDIGNGNVGNKSYVGDIRFKDLNDDGRINSGKNTLEDHGDLTVVGNSSSQYPFSLDLGGEWKGFSARVYLQGIGKRDWYPGGGSIYFWGIYSQPWTNVTKHNLDHWTPDNPNGYFPAVRAYAAEVSGRSLAATNDHYLQNAAYMRVKNITFGYSLPKHTLEKAGLGKVYFYFSGENLFEKSYLKVPLDPEGFSGNLYPFQRTYSFGMNLTF